MIQYIQVRLSSTWRQKYKCVELSGVFEMERFVKIVNGFLPLTIFAKRFILDIWKGFEYATGTILKTYLEPCQISMIELFRENSEPLLISCSLFSQETSILIVLQGHKYASAFVYSIQKEIPSKKIETVSKQWNSRLKKQKQLNTTWSKKWHRLYGWYT